MSSSRKLFVALAATLAAALAPATAALAGGGGGGVAGPCGTITALSAGTVTLSATSGGYTAGPLSVRGSVKNCSIYLQSYWIDFDEPAAATPACAAAFSLFNALLLSSGATQGFSTSTTITPVAVTSTVGCAGTHTLRAVLRSRTDGRVLSTASTTYAVVVK